MSDSFMENNARGNKVVAHIVGVPHPGVYLRHPLLGDRSTRDGMHEDG